MRQNTSAKGDAGVFWFGRGFGTVTLIDASRKLFGIGQCEARRGDRGTFAPLWNENVGDEGREKREERRELRVESRE